MSSHSGKSAQRSESSHHSTNQPTLQRASSQQMPGRGALADPRHAAPTDVLALQSTIGNQALQRLLVQQGLISPPAPVGPARTSPSTIQRKIVDGKGKELDETQTEQALLGRRLRHLTDKQKRMVKLLVNDHATHSVHDVESMVKAAALEEIQELAKPRLFTEAVADTDKRLEAEAEEHKKNKEIRRDYKDEKLKRKLRRAEVEYKLFSGMNPHLESVFKQRYEGEVKYLKNEYQNPARDKKANEDADTTDRNENLDLVNKVTMGATMPGAAPLVGGSISHGVTNIGNSGNHTADPTNIDDGFSVGGAGLLNVGAIALAGLEAGGAVKKITQADKNSVEKKTGMEELGKAGLALGKGATNAARNATGAVTAFANDPAAAVTPGLGIGAAGIGATEQGYQVFHAIKGHHKLGKILQQLEADGKGDTPIAAVLDSFQELQTETEVFAGLHAIGYAGMVVGDVLLLTGFGAPIGIGVRIAGTAWNLLASAVHKGMEYHTAHKANKHEKHQEDDLNLEDKDASARKLLREDPWRAADYLVDLAIDKKDLQAIAALKAFGIKDKHITNGDKDKLRKQILQRLGKADQESKTFLQDLSSAATRVGEFFIKKNHELRRLAEARNKLNYGGISDRDEKQWAARHDWIDAEREKRYLLKAMKAYETMGAEHTNLNLKKFDTKIYDLLERREDRHEKKEEKKQEDKAAARKQKLQPEVEARLTREAEEAIRKYGKKP